jgi:hypothetical protein
MLFVLLFVFAALMNIVLGTHAWPGVLAGSLNDPDSYMRLLRIEQGLHAHHLVVSVARDDSGAGVMVEWSRLLDILLVVMASPMALFIGWHRALFAAGVALGPLGVGALGAILAWVMEPFAARKFLWAAAAAAAMLPGLLTFAQPGVVHYHILLLVLIAATVGFTARAWRDEPGTGFLAGMAGGFAIWLTPETMPFVLMAFAALLMRWWRVPLGRSMTYCAAGFIDVLAFGLTVDPPQGGYGVMEIDRLSAVYVVLALFLLAGCGALWRLETGIWRWRRPAGAGLMGALILGWIAIYPKVAMGPYGVLPPDQMHKFFGAMLELQPVRGMDRIVWLAPGALALAYALWRAAFGRARLLWGYIALCLAVAFVLGARYVLFVEFSAAAAAGLLPLMLSDVTLLCARNEGLAGTARIGVLIAMLGVPFAAGFIPKPAPAKTPGGPYPSCSLRHISPLLATAGHEVVLAPAEDTPELLYRSQIETVGSLYQHGVPGYLRLRDAWRAKPGAEEPPEMQATKAAYVLFCPQSLRYPLVADLPKDTLWDALAAGAPPPWLTLVGQDAAGWRLYRVLYAGK